MEGLVKASARHRRSQRLFSWCCWAPTCSTPVWSSRRCRPNSPIGSESGLPPLSVMFAILLSLYFLGCVMDSLAMILLTIPIFYPVVMGLDSGYVAGRQVDLVRYPLH